MFGTSRPAAADDLQKVSGIARAIVTRYGMHAGLGHVVYEDRPNWLGQVAPNNRRAAIRRGDGARDQGVAVREIVAAAYRRTLDLESASRCCTSAAELLVRRTLSEVELDALLQEIFVLAV